MISCGRPLVLFAKVSGQTASTKELNWARRKALKGHVLSASGAYDGVLLDQRPFILVNMLNAQRKYHLSSWMLCADSYNISLSNMLHDLEFRGNSQHYRIFSCNMFDINYDVHKFLPVQLLLPVLFAYISKLTHWKGERIVKSYKLPRSLCTCFCRTAPTASPERLWKHTSYPNSGSNG